MAIGDLVMNTDSDGGYQLQHRPTSGQAVGAGARVSPRQLDLSQRGASLDIQLQPNPVRAIYMTYFAIGGDDYRQEMYHLLDTTEVNAVVIDVKGDYGLLSYKSRVPLADRSAPTRADHRRPRRALARPASARRVRHRPHRGLQRQHAGAQRRRAPGSTSA